MRILILTDHKTHSESDSIYGICQSLKSAGSIVHIASRGVEKNGLFFDGINANHIYSKPVDNNFAFSNINTWFDQSKKTLLSSFRGMFLRLDAPISDSWLSWLNEATSIACLNDPVGIQRTRKREYLTSIGNDAFPSTFASSLSELIEVLATRDCVIKLDNSHGGEGITLIRGADRLGIWSGLPRSRIDAIVRNISEFGGVLVQNYTNNVDQGDKRFLVAFGSLLGSFIRKPADGGWLCNLSQGGSIGPSTIEEEEKQLVKRVNAILSAEGVHIYGIDTLMIDNRNRKVSELNVMNPGGFVQIERFSGTPILEILAEKALFHFAS